MVNTAKLVAQLLRDHKFNLTQPILDIFKIVRFDIKPEMIDCASPDIVEMLAIEIWGELCKQIFELIQRPDFRAAFVMESNLHQLHDILKHSQMH